MTRTYLIVGLLALISALPSTCIAQQVVEAPAPSSDAKATDPSADAKAPAPTTDLKGPEITQTSWNPGSYVDDKALQIYLQYHAEQLMTLEGFVPAAEIKASFKTIPKSVSLPQFDKFQQQQTEEQQGNEAFTNAYKSSLVFGNLYNCGHCNKKHLSAAGGVVLSADGLVLTNHHVFNPKNERDFHSFFVMTCDGKVYPVIELLAADEKTDLALVRVDATDLTPVKLAPESPLPGDDLFVISHPQHRFFKTTKGVVSRYVEHANRRSEQERWMEITAFFSQGSSGSGTFNSDGELVGLVSRKEEVKINTISKTIQLMTVFKCVPLHSIKSLFGLETATE